jgi:hypothetical protein
VNSCCECVFVAPSITVVATGGPPLANWLGLVNPVRTGRRGISWMNGLWMGGLDGLPLSAKALELRPCLTTSVPPAVRRAHSDHIPPAEIGPDDFLTISLSRHSQPVFPTSHALSPVRLLTVPNYQAGILLRPHNHIVRTRWLAASGPKRDWCHFREQLPTKTWQYAHFSDITRYTTN